MKKQVQVEIESSGYDLGQAIARVIAAIKVASANGFDLSKELPVMVTEAVAELPGIMSDIGSVGADASEDQMELVKGLNLAAYDILKAVKG